MNELICDENFMLFAAKHYDNPQCTNTEEFIDDIKRIKYIKRLFNKYDECGELKERLILNHIIVLYNVFGQAATKMLFLKLEGYYHYLKPFIVLLGYMPEIIYNVNNKNIISSNIKMDEKIICMLRKI